MGVCSDEIYVVNFPRCPVSENSIGMPPLRILCGLYPPYSLFRKKKEVARKD